MRGARCGKDTSELPSAFIGKPVPVFDLEPLADLNANELNCIPLQDPAILAERKAKWEKVVADNGGIHPNCGEANTRLLMRMRRLAVPAVQGSGMHPDRQLWVNDPREPVVSSFEPKNKYR